MKRIASILACLTLFCAIVFALASCSKPEAPHVHDYTVFETVESTCTQRGHVTYACRCGNSYVDELSVKAHTEVEIPGVAPDCVNTGLSAGIKCSVCDTVIKRQSVLSPLGHEVGEAATCTTDQTCTRCDHVFMPARGHIEAIDRAVAPTCTETGLTEGKHCSVCDEVLTQQTVVDSLGHTEVTDEAIAPTCTSAGLTEGKHCSTCGEVLIAQTVVDALGHTEVIDAAVKSTCTATGLTEGKHCSVCDEVLVAQGVTDMKPHTYDEAVGGVFDNDCNVCGAVRNCAHETTEVVSGYAATCTEPGLTDGLKCSICSAVLKSREVIDALDHDYIAHDAKDANCTDIGWFAYNTCSRCDYTTYSEIAATGHTEIVDTAVEPTCTETGLTEGKHCSVCGEVFTAQNVVDALGHTKVVDAAVEPTCTTSGLTEGEHCSVCGEVFTQQNVIDALGHTEVTDTAVEPTCTETGLTEGKHCSVCGEVLVAQTVTNALGHSFVDGSCVNKCGNHYLTLDFATAEGLEGNNGVYMVKEGTSVTITAEYDPTCIFAGFERDGIDGSHEETGDSGTYTFTMPDKAVAYESVYYNTTDLVLESSLVKNGISVSKSVSTYTNGDTGVTYKKYYVTKGCTTDGTYIYAILNAKTGSTAGSGFDIGIIAKFDKNGNFLNVTTEYAFQWGNIAKLAYVDGKLVVTVTNAAASNKYGDTKVYNGKNLVFDTDLKLVDDDYTFEYPDAPEGKIVTHVAQRADGYLCVVYDVGINKGDYTICLYKENASGSYELAAENNSPVFDSENNNNTRISSVWCSDDYVYLLYYTTNYFRVKLVDYSGEYVFERGLSKTAETNSASSNYQGIFEIDGTAYYTIANWSKYSGLGIYKVDFDYSYERVQNYNTLTVKNATVEGLEGNDGVYTVRRGAVVTVKANPMTSDCIYIGFEKDGIDNNFVCDSKSYTFTMPAKAVSLEAIYDAVDLVLESALVKNGISVSKSVSTYTNGGTGVTYKKYYVTKGCTTDGTYIYAILNAKTGNKAGSGFDIGIIAKFDKNGNFVDATTANAYQWGNIARLAYIDGKLVVTNTNATAATAYGDTKVYNGKNLVFDTDLKLIDDDYTFSYPNAPEGKMLSLLAERSDGYLCVVYDVGANSGNYTICLYKKNASGQYELVAQNDSTDLAKANNSNRWISGVWCSDNYIYLLYTATGAIRVKLIDYSGNIVFERALATTAETDAANGNYQSIFEIDGVAYYTIANWKSYSGFGIYSLDCQYSYERIRDYTVSFDTNGADAVIDSQILTKGSKVEKPETPSYSYTNPDGVIYNFVFDNWYCGEEIWDFDTDVVTEDITLKAKWTLEESFFAEKENASARAEDTTIRAMSFNILADDWNNKPPVDATRTSNVVNTINRYLPDVVGLQECDDQWYAALSSSFDSYKFVNYSSSGENKLTYNGKQYTNYSTILYNTTVLELVEWSQEYLPTCDNRACRIITVALFEIKETGKQFIFASTHWNLTEAARVSQANETAAVLKTWEEKYPDVPVMMSGDFNAKDSTSPITTFVAATGYTDAKKAATKGLLCNNYHLGNGMLTGDRVVSNPNHWLRGRISFTAQNVLTTESIDHIFVSQLVESLFYDTVHDDDALNASDHLPIYCDLKF